MTKHGRRCGEDGAETAESHWCGYYNAQPGKIFRRSHRRMRSRRMLSHDLKVVVGREEGARIAASLSSHRDTRRKGTISLRSFQWELQPRYLIFRYLLSEPSCTTLSTSIGLSRGCASGAEKRCALRGHGRTTQPIRSSQIVPRKVVKTGPEHVSSARGLPIPCRRNKRESWGSEEAGSSSRSLVVEDRKRLGEGRETKKFGEGRRCVGQVRRTDT